MFNVKNKVSKIILGVIAVGFVASSTTLADDYMYVKATHLNVRASETVRSKIVAVVDSGYKVTVLESFNSGWKKVLLENGQEGYVNGKFLVEAEPYYEKVTASRYTIKSGSAFMRDFSLNKIVAVLNQGDVLEVTSEKVYLNRWVQVKVVNAKHSRYNERTGYVAKRLLSELEGYAYVAPVETQVENTYVEDTQSSSDESVQMQVEDPLPELNSAPETEETITVEPETEEVITTEDDSIDAELEALLKGLE